jgi:hypothetical protein
MKSSQVLIAAAALGAALVTAASAASPTPYLRSATAVNRHVVITYTLGELLPGRVLAATAPRRETNGRFVQANVKLNEPLSGTRTASGLRLRTRHALRPGRYYVEVSGTVMGLDCTPHKPCKTNWSNIRRVIVK